MEVSDRDRQILSERANHDGFETIGRRHDLSRQRVHQIVQANLNAIEMELLRQAKRGKPVVVTLPAAERDYAYTFGDVVFTLLRQRGVEVEVTVEEDDDEILLGFEDITDYGRTS